MFLQNLRVAPALWPVELGHHRAAIFQLHLVDTVFVRGQRGESPVAAQAHAVERIEHHVGRERVKRMATRCVLHQPNGPRSSPKREATSESESE